MKVTFEGEPKEIIALVKQTQEQLRVEQVIELSEKIEHVNDELQSLQGVLLADRAKWIETIEDQ